MNLIIALIVGTVGGWLASVITSAGREAPVRNVIAGVAGAYVGRWVLGLVADPVEPGTFTLGVMIASILGAAALLLFVGRLDRA